MLFYLFFQNKSRNFAPVIELNRHIEILLLSNDCVIIPNFGGFLAHYVSARHEDDEYLFLPPSRTIGFNSQLKLNDHLLVQSYVEAYDLSYPEALRRIESEVEEMKQHLNNEGHYELTDLGTLSLNEDGNYEFEPCEAGILTPALYGLSSFEMQPLGVQQNSKKEIAEEKVAVISSEDEPQKEEATAQIVSIEDEDNKDSAIVIQMSWVRNLIATAVAVLLFFFISTPVDNSGVQTDRQESSFLPVSINDAGSQESTTSEATLQEAEEKDSIINPENAVSQPVDEHEHEAATEETSHVGEYTIVLASQTTRHHAEAFVERLAQKGVTGISIVKMENMNKVRVICGYYSTLEEAQSQLLTRRETGDTFNEAWILHIH